VDRVGATRRGVIHSPAPAYRTIRRVLARIQLPLDVAIDPGIAQQPTTWIVVGAVVALVGLFVARRARKLAILMTVGTAGAVWAWSSGALSLAG
ncbi:MAG: hypothetical protein VX682_00630, partial [Actinomycetota bacterium]|nr:hypothetical protein [Actinomycetota bacterium]